jgi:hypothetical protein
LAGQNERNKTQSSQQILRKSFRIFFNYAAGFVGEKKTLEFAEKSHENICRYYRHLSDIQLSEEGKIRFAQNKITDSEILGFSLWMRQFMEELKSFMVGIGRTDPEEITAEMKDELKTIGFFEFYEQAKELKY